MVQTTTRQNMYRMLPGHISTPEGPGRETESLLVPYTPQALTFTLGGTTPVVAGNYDLPFVTPANGTLIVRVTATGVETFTDFASAIAAAINAKLGVGSLVSATSAAGVVTAVVRSANLSLPVPVPVVPDATTITAAQSVAAASLGLRIGVWYVYGPTPPGFVGAITGTPRAPRIGALPNSSTTIAQLRGVVARTANQTQQAPAGSANVPDAYEAPQVGYGALRGKVDVVVDPASGTFVESSPVYVVIAAGVYSVIGSVVTAPDGAKTLRLDDTTPVRARVGAGDVTEEAHTFGGSSVRLVRLQVNQTN